jgi:hypothetical protein
LFVCLFCLLSAAAAYAAELLCVLVLVFFRDFFGSISFGGSGRDGSLSGGIEGKVVVGGIFE